MEIKELVNKKFILGVSLLACLSLAISLSFSTQWLPDRTNTHAEPDATP